MPRQAHQDAIIGKLDSATPGMAALANNSVGYAECRYGLRRVWTVPGGYARRRMDMAGVVVDLKMKNEDKEKALEAAIGQIEKAFGKGSVMKLVQRESAVDVQSISTASLVLDIGLDIAGFSQGPVLQIYGSELPGNTRF